MELLLEALAIASSAKTKKSHSDRTNDVAKEKRKRARFLQTQLKTRSLTKEEWDLVHWIENIDAKKKKKDQEPEVQKANRLYKQVSRSKTANKRLKEDNDKHIADEENRIRQEQQCMESHETSSPQKEKEKSRGKRKTKVDDGLTIVEGKRGRSTQPQTTKEKIAAKISGGKCDENNVWMQLETEELTEPVYVPNYGMCLEATCQIPKNIDVVQYSHTVVKHQKRVNDIARSTTHESRDKIVEIAGKRKGTKPGKRLWLIGNIMNGHLGALAEHCCSCMWECNCGFDYRLVDETYECFLVAKRIIEQGERIRWDYESPWDYEQDEGNPNRLWMKEKVVCKGEECPFYAFFEELKKPKHLRNPNVPIPSLYQDRYISTMNGIEQAP